MRTMTNAIPLGLIWVYQKWISPKKGYSCAYRLEHGGTGCSGYVKQAIEENGLIRSVPKIKQRFAACKESAKKKRRQCDGECNRVNACDGFDLLACCAISNIGCDGCDGGCDGCG